MVLKIKFLVAVIFVHAATFTSHLMGQEERTFLTRVCETLLWKRILLPPNANWCSPLLKCAVDFAHPEQKNPVKEGVYVRTENEFRQDVIDANRTVDGLFTPLEIHQNLYRLTVDSTPEFIKKAKGLFPNPSLPKGDLATHVLGFGSSLSKDGIDVVEAGGLFVPLVNDTTTGTGSYVSMSWDSDPSGFLRTASKQLFNKYPDKIAYDDVLSTNYLTKKDWQSLYYKRWNIDPAIERRPTTLVFQFYQHWVKDMLGTKVLGGPFAKEKEVVVRGVPLNQIKAWRIVLVKLPITFKRVTTFEGLTYDAMTSPSSSVEAILNGQYKIEYGSWIEYE